MRKPSTIERTRLKADQAVAMKDTCLILTFSQEVASYRQGAGTFTAGSAMACGYKPTAVNEYHDDQEVARIDGRLRLPVGTAITSKDRIRLTHVDGDALNSALDFKIYGKPQIRPTVIICKLQAVTDGST